MLKGTAALPWFNSRVCNQIRMSSSVTKPPNILVHTEKATASSKILLKKVQAVVSGEHYVVYPIETEQLLSTPWAKNTLLLIIQNKLKLNVLEKVETYLDSGGKVLDFSSNIAENARGYVNIKTEINSLSSTELVNILNNDLRIESVGEDDLKINYSYGYLVSNSEVMNVFFKSKRLLETNTLVQSKITLDFSTNQENPSENYLPIKTVTPPNFNTSKYLDHLNTSSLGQPLILVPTISSSMVPFVGPPIFHGFTVVPQRQASGHGRGGNKWLSPPGCSMFSIQIFLNTTSFLGTRPSLIQHLVALAQVHAIRSRAEYKDIDIRLKWPNDIYFGKSVKLGGVIAKGSIIRDDFIVTIGAGLNLDNEHPTSSINRVIEESGKEKLTQEELLANTLNVLEDLIDKCNSGHFPEVEALYYKYWLHGEQKIKISENYDNVETFRNVTVRGIDEFGFLKVVGDNGVDFTVFDDGNSFDMMEGLIRPKTRLTIE